MELFPEVFLTSHKFILSSEFRANDKIDQGQVENDQGQLINYLFYLFISFIWPNSPTFQSIDAVAVNTLLLTWNFRKFYVRAYENY